MSQNVSRRWFLAGAGSAAGLAVAGSAGLAEAVPAKAGRSARPARPALGQPPGPVTVTSDDPRYTDLLLRNYNKRLESHPDSIRVVGNTEHVIQAVNDAVANGKRIAIRGGGHCLDGLVANPEVQVLIDFTEMRDVKFDPSMNAFLIEPGATLGQIYRTLDYGWAVTLPGGVCPVVGAGGHIAGNGFGALSRRYGSIADHLYAVEVVVVGADGVARAVIATREASDPNRDLWWAHTGAGGGNFGVVTRYWMRSIGPSSSTAPSALLPPAPRAMLTGQVSFSWPQMTEADFIRFASNWGSWVERNSSPDSAGRLLHGAIDAPRKEGGTLLAFGQIDPTVPGAQAVLDDYLAAMTAGVSAPASTARSGELPWLTSTISAPDSSVASGVTGPPRWKSKVAHMKRPFTDAQLSTAYRYLTRTDYNHAPSSFSMTAYGGQINALAAGATATPHRQSVLLASVSSVWDVVAEDATHLAWTRGFYRDLFAATGGAPVPNDQTDGLHPNWPDLDMVDPAWNSSGMSVQQLLHKENYPKLQRIKAQYDPRNIFRHQVSVQLPSS
jgi:FAD binding domain/Berberine and berberine like